MEKKGSFRFTYFTDKYQDTFNFYKDQLGFKLGHSWDRSEHDKGALFEAGQGLVEILHRAEKEEYQIPGLDYRIPQGVFMGVQVWNIDELYQEFKGKGIPFNQEITDQSWGHRSFSIIEPNGLTLFFYQEQF